ncbi:MAG: hypothetical protein AB8B71_05450 [Paracoccaceae bacterium]
MALRYRLTRAAELAEASYTGKPHAQISYQWKASLDVSDVQAHLLTDNTLLIPGSNSIRDYIRYNLRIQRLGKRRLKLANQISNAPITWHQGFLAHAKIVQDWLMDNNFTPAFVIGHSLGAASAQILSAGWAIPAIAFAAPRPCRTATAQMAARYCLCVNRTDDGVCKLPGGFHHLGDVRACKPRGPSPGMDHAMPHYRKIVDEGLAAQKLPATWPLR